MIKLETLARKFGNVYVTFTLYQDEDDDFSDVGSLLVDGPYQPLDKNQAMVGLKSGAIRLAGDDRWHDAHGRFIPDPDPLSRDEWVVVEWVTTYGEAWERAELLYWWARGKWVSLGLVCEIGDGRSGVALGSDSLWCIRELDAHPDQLLARLRGYMTDLRHGAYIEAQKSRKAWLEWARSAVVRPASDAASN